MVCAGREADDKNLFGVAPVFSRMALQPGYRGAHLACALRPFRTRRETIPAIDADVAQAGEVVRDVRGRRAAASDETPAMKHDDHRHRTIGPAHGRRMNVDLL